jgi:hypothetical protein
MPKVTLNLKVRSFGKIKVYVNAFTFSLFVPAFLAFYFKGGILVLILFRF